MPDEAVEHGASQSSPVTKVACPPAGTGAGAPRSGVRTQRAGVEGLRLAGTEPSGGGVGPGMAVRACRAYRGRGGEREDGVDLCDGQVSVYSWSSNG